MAEKLAAKQKMSEKEKKHLAEVEEKRRQEAAATEMKTLLENEAAAWQILLAH